MDAVTIDIEQCNVYLTALRECTTKDYSPYGQPGRENYTDLESELVKTAKHHQLFLLKVK